MFSIIVPIYNVQDFLLECLNSIKYQTYSDYEVILVNDGSLDLSGVIAKNFSENNDKFKYYEKINGGLSDARNFGLGLASRDYIIFIDSDDIISNNYLESLNSVITNNPNLDLIIIDYFRFTERKNEFNKNGYSSMCLTRFELATIPNFSWLRVAKRSLYDGLKFPYGYLYEDVYISPLLCGRAKNIVFLNGKLYGYRIRVNSITKTNIENQLSSLNTIRKLSRDYPKITSEKFFKIMYIYMSWSIIINICRQRNYEVIKCNLLIFVKQIKEFNIEDTVDKKIKIKNRLLIKPFLGGYKIAIIAVYLLKPLVLIYDKFITKNNLIR
ncbi:glycosyltransferase [Rosenbergiella epipactidis]|uniref:glycosyltransferase family 2 protein n=1 Tax=Rosenbergiella epipactidis TaxID=1544694 RepID=UPI0020273A30|nr:glycosyltransferase [Rosenbergiella epipactidis]MCL9667438.1 glycosyltransferase [Rosenbergiella epipactidis]